MWNNRSTLKLYSILEIQIINDRTLSGHDRIASAIDSWMSPSDRILLGWRSFTFDEKIDSKSKDRLVQRYLELLGTI